MPGDAVPDRVGCSGESQLDEPRVAEQAQHRGFQRAQFQGIARPQLGRRGPVFRAAAMIAGAEDDGDELPHVVHRQRAPAGQADLDDGSGPRMHAIEAGGYRGGVVGDDQVVGAQVVGQVRARSVTEPAVWSDDQEPGVRRALGWRGGGFHPVVSSLVRRLR